MVADHRAVDEFSGWAEAEDTLKQFVGLLVHLAEKQTGSAIVRWSAEKQTPATVRRTWSSSLSGSARPGVTAEYTRSTGPDSRGHDSPRPLASLYGSQVEGLHRLGQFRGVCRLAQVEVRGDLGARDRHHHPPLMRLSPVACSGLCRMR